MTESIDSSQGIRNKTLNALSWSFIERFSQQFLQFLISIILARLLSPEEFGLIAMLAIFFALAESFIDSGFGSALIQKKNIDHLDECSIFYFNIVIGLISTFVLYFGAPYIANFYRMPILIPLSRLLSINTLINSFGLIQSTLLTRQVNFKIQTQVSLIASIISGIISLIMAFKGFGVWSLAAQSLTSNLFRTSLLWFFLGWRPSWRFSLISLRSMFKFGSLMFLSGLIDTFFNNLYLLVIGKFFSAQDLGFYSRANQIQQLQSSNITNSISRVSFPVFSSIQDDKIRLRRAVSKALRLMVFLNFPMMVCLFVVSRPLIFSLLGENWLPCVPYLQLLCINGFIYPLHVINLNALKSQGRSDLFFNLELIKKIIIVISIILTFDFGIKGLIYGQIISSILSYFMNSYYTGSILKYSVKDQILDVSPSLLISVIMGGIIYSFGNLLIDNCFILLLTQTLSGICLYILLCLLFKNKAFFEAIDIIMPKITDIKNSVLFRYC